jgi:hypothetical protein
MDERRAVGAEGTVEGGVRIHRDWRFGVGLGFGFGKRDSGKVRKECGS